MSEQTVYDAMPEATEERIAVARQKIYAAMDESRLPVAHLYTLLSVIRQQTMGMMI